MKAFHPGLCSVTFRKLPPEQIIDLAAGCGIEGIEWAGDVHVAPGDYGTARRVRQLTEEAGLSVISYGSYIAPPSDDEEAFSVVVETAHALGASNIRIWPGSRNRESVTYSAEERRHTAQLIRRMARHANDASITISLEYHPNSLTDDLSSAHKLMEEIADSNAYLYWQPRPGLPLEDALGEIHAIGNQVSHVHVFAWDRERRRYPLADQQEYWRTVLTAAPETRWHGKRYAMLEFVKDDSPDQFRDDASTFSRLLEEVQRQTAGAA
jgi:sugar phosphate isomerase/epimerase